MSAVNPPIRPTEVQAGMLMGILLREIQETFAEEEGAGLRMSHLRVLTCVPDDGVSVTELADRVGMTKQGCGQFVTQLVASGHLQIGPDRGDRRVRLVCRTALGDQTIADATARIHRIEDDWASQVGPRRYGTFRKVLHQLALARE